MSMTNILLSNDGRKSKTVSLLFTIRRRGTIQNYFLANYNLFKETAKHFKWFRIVESI